MGKKGTRAKHKPTLPDPDGLIALSLSDSEPRSITVKLTGEESRTLARCRQLLAGPEGAHYPSLSRAVRLAIGLLYHSLTGHPPSKGADDATKHSPTQT
jgi:hypothetical protein